MKRGFRAIHFIPRTVGFRALTDFALMILRPKLAVNGSTHSIVGGLGGMTLTSFVAALQPILQSTLVASLGTAFLGIVTALFTFRYQSRERIDGAITWQWKMDYDGDLNEEPFLTLHNRSSTAAYLKDARYLAGNFVRTVALRYAFEYVSITDGSFPMEVKAGSARSFPLAKHDADKLVAKARWYNKVVGYLLKRPYLWIEVRTIGGGRLIVPANDATDFQKRPRWIDLRWLPEK